MNHHNNTSVCVIYAGGTFGCYGNPLQPLPWSVFKPILAQTLHQLQQQNIIVTSSYQLKAADIIKDSSQLTPADFAVLYRQILQQAMMGYRHIILITGTDTLSYLAAFLSHAFAGSGLGLVLTASMQPLLKSTDVPHQPNTTSDALANLALAFMQVVQQQHSVSIAIAGEVYDARYSQKIHTTAINAFNGVVLSRQDNSDNACDGCHNTQERIKTVHWLNKRQTVLSEHIEQLNKLYIATCFAVPQMPAQLVKQLKNLLTQQPQGLLLIGLGAGNFLRDSHVNHMLIQAQKQGCVVVQATQVPFGGCHTDYAAASWLQSCGVLPSAQLSVASSYARLLWLLTAFKPSDNVAKMATVREQWFTLLNDDIHFSHWH